MPEPSADTAIDAASRISVSPKKPMVCGAADRVHADDVRAERAQGHAARRTCNEARALEDAQTLQWTLLGEEGGGMTHERIVHNIF